jgi:heme O synthase-like polyprenyltransferase
MDMTVARLGTAKYIAGNWLIMVALVLLYQFTPLQIEWLGLIVIAIYAVVYWLVAQRRRLLVAS